MRNNFFLIQFLRLCNGTNIKIIAADTQEIYRPVGIDNIKYGLTDRLESLNEKIFGLYHEHKKNGKMLIIVGASHSNHINATASRSGMGESKPDYKTPGLTDIISDSQEMIVVQKRSETEMATRVPLVSIRDGIAFQVEV